MSDAKWEPTVKWSDVGADAAASVEGGAKALGDAGRVVGGLVVFAAVSAAAVGIVWLAISVVRWAWHHPLF